MRWCWLRAARQKKMARGGGTHVHSLDLVLFLEVPLLALRRCDSRGIHRGRGASGYGAAPRRIYLSFFAAVVISIRRLASTTAHGETVGVS